MATKKTARPSPLGALVGSVRKRYRLFVAAAALLLLGIVGQQVWRHAQTGMRQDPRYRVTAATIQTPPPPPWIRTDIRLEALRDAGLHGDLSILDPPEQLQKRLASAFAFHPWVEQVGTITKQPPNRIFIELAYRRPLAAVQQIATPRLASSQASGPLVAVDRHGVRLPSADLTQAQIRYLPRVADIASTSLPGEVWRDARLQGAVALVDAFGAKWAQLELVEVVPDRQPNIRGDLRFPVYELVTNWRTRIIWGAAPNVTPPGEASFATKLARLEGYLAKHGKFHQSTGLAPEVLNIRDDRIDVKHRTAKKKEPGQEEKPIVK